MPVLPSRLFDPLREQLFALVDIAQPAGLDRHPLDCHRPRITDGVVLDRLVQFLVLGDAQRSTTTLCRRRDEWVRAGLYAQLRVMVLAWGHLPRAGDFDAMIGLDLHGVAIDGCLTKGPSVAIALVVAPSTAARVGSSASSYMMGMASRWPPLPHQATAATINSCSHPWMR